MFYNYYSYIHVIRGSCDVSMRIRMSRRLSFVIVLCSHSMWSIHTFKYYAREVPPPLCLLLSRNVVHIILYSMDCQLKLPFSSRSIAWSDDQRKLENTRILVPNLCKCWFNSWWLSETRGRHHMVTFRRESRGYQRVQQEDRVSNQPSDQETQPKSKLLIKQTL